LILVYLLYNSCKDRELNPTTIFTTILVTCGVCLSSVPGSFPFIFKHILVIVSLKSNQAMHFHFIMAFVDTILAIKTVKWKDFKFEILLAGLVVSTIWWDCIHKLLNVFEDSTQCVLTLCAWKEYSSSNLALLQNEF